MHALETDLADSVVCAIDCLPIITARCYDSQDPAAGRDDVRSALRRTRVKHMYARERFGGLKAPNDLAGFVRIGISAGRENDPHARIGIQRHSWRRELASGGAHEERRQIL